MNNNNIIRYFSVLDLLSTGGTCTCKLYQQYCVKKIMSNYICSIIASCGRYEAPEVLTKLIYRYSFFYIQIRIQIRFYIRFYSKIVSNFVMQTYLTNKFHSKKLYSYRFTIVYWTKELHESRVNTEDLKKRTRRGSQICEEI